MKQEVHVVKYIHFQTKIYQTKDLCLMENESHQEKRRKNLHSQIFK